MCKKIYFCELSKNLSTYSYFVRPKEKKKEIRV